MRLASRSDDGRALRAQRTRTGPGPGVVPAGDAERAVIGMSPTHTGQPGRSRRFGVFATCIEVRRSFTGTNPLGPGTAQSAPAAG